MSIIGEIPVRAKVSDLTPAGIHRLFVEGISACLVCLNEEVDLDWYVEEGIEPTIVIATPSGEECNLFLGVVRALKEGNIEAFLKKQLKILLTEGGEFTLEVFSCMPGTIIVIVDREDEKNSITFEVETGTGLFDAKLLFEVLRDGQGKGEVEGFTWNDVYYHVILDPNPRCKDCLDDGRLFACSKCGQRFITICEECSKDNARMKNEGGTWKYLCWNCVDE